MKGPDNFNSDNAPFKVDFNENQKAAVRRLKGPVLVIAGPGSGKTAVIAGRLEHMINFYKAAPEKILVVTFSKKAAAEMRQRFERTMPDAEKTPLFSTFHSFFYSVIRKEKGGSLKVISDARKYNALRSFACGLGLDFEGDPGFFSSLSGEISRVKGGLLDINGYAPQCLAGEPFKIIYREYGAYLRTNGLIDFDDMELECLRLLSENAAVLKKWQERFPYIMIDEFQDINLIQYEIVRLLAGEDKNVFAVGDDDQSIYGFRGARPSLMKRFLKDFKGARKILLDINYRSCPEIVSAAGSLIKENEERFAKNIRPFKGCKTPGSVYILSFKDSKEEADDIAKKICCLKKEGIPLHEIAVLFRNNADMEYISRRLQDLSFDVSGAKKEDLHAGFISRDIRAYLNAARSYPLCGLSDILTVMNRPGRYILRRSLLLHEDPFISMRLFYSRNERMLAVIKEFESSLRLLKSLPSFAAVKYIRSVIGYDSFITEYAKEARTDAGKYLDILDRLENEAKAFESVPLWLSHIKSEEDEILKAGTRKDEKPKEESGINILTIHASKGLEWEAVFIPTCIDAVIPGKNTDTQSALEEERRILYVAMTRAKSFLQISTVSTYKGKEARPSRFLNVL